MPHKVVNYITNYSFVPVQVGFSGVHPELDNNPEFQAWIAENTGRRHRFFDGSDVRYTFNLCSFHCCVLKSSKNSSLQLDF